MKKLNITLLAAGLMLVGFSAQAITAQNGFYVGVDGGQGYMMAPAVPLTNNWINNINNFDTSSAVWGAYAGYHWAANQNVMWGVEMGYSQNGSSSYAGSGLPGDTGSLTYNNSSVNLLGTFSYVGDYGINGFAKLGIAYVTQTADVTGPVYINGIQQNSSNTSTSQAEPMLGLGIGYMPTQNFNIYLESDLIGGNLRPSDWVFANNADYNQKIYATASFRAGVSYLF
ncbi:MAG: hypothetical protein K0S29_35 [Gammaproteobacteria bacterium]|nr:hypothetical protein [Gammaproteobacteria bacterium]